MSVLHTVCLGKEVKGSRYILQTSPSPEMSSWQQYRALSRVQAAAGLRALPCVLAGGDRSRTRGLQEAVPRGERVMRAPHGTLLLMCDQLGIPFLLTVLPNLPAATSQG